MFFLSNSTQIP